MSSADEGRTRAEEHLSLVAAGDARAAELVLADTTDLAALTYLGAAFTAISRSGARELSPAQRAQSTGRHMRITALRDAARRDPTALRGWLTAVAGEAAFVRGMQATAARRAAEATGAGETD